MTERQRGIWAMVAACVIWGLSPLYWQFLNHVPPYEILAHRTFWSFVTFLGVLALQRRMTAFVGVFRNRTSLWATSLGAVLITVNWFLFLLAIQIGRLTESALGYYIFPLVAVSLGVIVLRERLGRTQWVAVGLATLAVGIMTIGSGAAPWISLVLALTFGLYGLVKKRVPYGPILSVTAEVAVLLPIAVLALVYWGALGVGHFGNGVGTTALLMFSGVQTALPLILFSWAAQRVPLAMVGVLQYVNPSLQFLCAVVVFGEAFTALNAVVFGLIWLALALYSGAQLRQDHR